MDAITHNNVYGKSFAEAKIYFSEMIGKKCSFQRTGEYRSLTLGFGEKVEVLNFKKKPVEQSEWRLGTYIAAWRIIRHGEIVCGNMDPVNSNSELDKKVLKINLGSLLFIEMLSKFEIRVGLDNDVCIDFIAATDYDDDIFHIFCPDHIFVSYKCAKGWHIGRSDRPV